jgi:hypothetical protein
MPIQINVNAIPSTTNPTEVFNSYSTATGTLFVNASTTYTYTQCTLLMPYDKAVISSELLFNLTKAGRNILGYIIDRALRPDNNYVVLDQKSITEYLEQRIDAKQANYYNIRRGIKDLIEKGVIIKDDTVPEEDTYMIVPTKISHKPVDSNVQTSF